MAESDGSQSTQILRSGDTFHIALQDPSCRVSIRIKLADGGRVRTDLRAGDDFEFTAGTGAAVITVQIDPQVMTLSAIDSPKAGAHGDGDD